MPKYRVAFTPDAAGAVGQLPELATALDDVGADGQVVSQVRVHDPGLTVEADRIEVDDGLFVFQALDNDLESEIAVAVIPIARVLHVTRVEDVEDVEDE